MPKPDRDETKPTIIILRESVVGSWLRDLGTFAVMGSLIGIGVLASMVGNSTSSLLPSNASSRGPNPLKRIP
jgi:hypothetical protein